MASIRRLKKDVNYLTYELISECLVYDEFHQGADKEKVKEVINSVIEGRNSMMDKISKRAKGKKKDKKENKKYFRSIDSDFTELVNKLDSLDQK
jgi:hypothetical protein